MTTRGDASQPLSQHANPLADGPSDRADAPLWAAAPLPLLLSLACATAGGALAVQHPRATWLAIALLAAAVAAGWARGHAWLIALPALLPICNLYPWTGWIVFEELDLLVLGIAAGGYARVAYIRRAAATPRRREVRSSVGVGPTAGLLLTLFLASVLISMARGVIDAGGFRFGWFQGYHEPMNSVRLAKPFAWALLLWPLWQSACRIDARRSGERLALGLMLGLAVTAGAAVWERLAYTGLLNFSTSYRTAALFWEMHVGGAAIDGFLALTLPFAVHALLTAKGRARWAVAATATLLGGYACLTTFSRGLYLAAPVGLAVLAGLLAAQRRRHVPVPGDVPIPPEAHGAPLRALYIVVAFGVAAAWMFPTSGYRGLIALIGAVAALLALPHLAQGLRAADVGLGIGLGTLLAGFAAGCAWLVPKGAYAAYAAAAVLTLATFHGAHTRRRVEAGTGRVAAVFALAAFVVLLGAMVLVARHWGYGPGFDRAWPVAILLLVVAVVASRHARPAWPESLRWQSTVLGAMLMTAGVVGVFGGGSYMTERFAKDTQSLGGRMQNWRLGAAWLETPFDWAFGKGLGRFAASYAFGMAGTDKRPGDLRVVTDASGTHLALGAGTHPIGWLELLRVSQRVDRPQGPLRVRAEVRAAKAVQIHFEVCEKHLLYSEACMNQTLSVPPGGDRWQPIDVQLEGNPPQGGTWYAPRLFVFALGVGNSGGRAEIDKLALTGADGVNLLENGDFENGLARWYFTSDGYHWPWHIEGILMSALFDQGVMGVLLLALLMAAGLWRLAFGRGRGHVLAPPFAAALVGFMFIGLFSSVTDVPRVAFLFYWFLLLGLGLRALPAPAR